MSLSQEDEAKNTLDYLKKNQETDNLDNYQIPKVYPRRIYLRDKAEITMQLVGIASGGQPYESSHNFYNGVKPPQDNSDDEVRVEEYDSLPNNSPRMSSYRSGKPQR